MSSVAIIGLGNIGSAAVPLVARLSGVSRLLLVDPDRYAEANLPTQAIDRSALGAAKVDAQAARIRRIDPGIRVEPVRDRIENAPVGLFRGATLLACVDNRLARQTVNRIAARCGSVWIDAAVGEPALARVAVYGAGDAAPCLECGWDEEAYELLEQEYPCRTGHIGVPATAAPAELGGLAAALQVIELRKRLTGVPAAQTLSGAQLMVDMGSYTRHLTRCRRNPQCRFDHETWHDIESTALDPRAHSLGDLFAAAGPGEEAMLSVEGHRFVTFVDCVACDRRRGVGLALYGRLDEQARTCSCGGAMLAAGFFSFEAIKQAELSRACRGMKLAALGLRPNDVVSVTDASGACRHLQIGGERKDG